LIADRQVVGIAIERIALKEFRNAHNNAIRKAEVGAGEVDRDRDYLSSHRRATVFKATYSGPECQVWKEWAEFNGGRSQWRRGEITMEIMLGLGNDDYGLGMDRDLYSVKGPWAAPGEQVDKGRVWPRARPALCSCERIVVGSLTALDAILTMCTCNESPGRLRRAA
jgi:hypothetical protein